LEKERERDSNFKKSHSLHSSCEMYFNLKIYVFSK